MKEGERRGKEGGKKDKGERKEEKEGGREEKMENKEANGELRFKLSSSLNPPPRRLQRWLWFNADFKLQIPIKCIL